jgi:hypothetical protein
MNKHLRCGAIPEWVLKLHGKQKKEIYPDLVLEYVTGAGPLTPLWDKAGLSFYPSGYYPELNPKKVAKAVEILKHADVFRTYDAAPLLVSTTTMQRIHDILSQTAGHEKYKATLNSRTIAILLLRWVYLLPLRGHPMKTPRMYKGKDFHLQIAGDRHVDRWLNEMDRMALWQRIAPPIPAGYGTYHASENFLIDSIVFHNSDTWLKATHGKMVRQSAPAVMARQISLPEVKSDGKAPYVLASKFPGGEVCIATEGRVSPDQSWFHPRADIILKDLEINKPIGIFGHYKSLSLNFGQNLPENVTIYAQDLMAKQAADITKEVKINHDMIIIPGSLIDKIGTSAGIKGDISVPGLVLKVVTY